MHIRARPSEQFPSGIELFTVQENHTEVLNLDAQSLWENAPQFEHPVHLKVLYHRTAEPILLIEFVEYGYSCVFQESNGVGEWYLELAPGDRCPPEVINSLRRHSLISDQLMAIAGDRYNKILTLTQLQGVAVPLWLSGANVDNAHEIDIYLENIVGVHCTFEGFIPMMASLDAQLSKLFLVVCGLKSPNGFTLKYIGGPGVAPDRRQTRYRYEWAMRRSISLRDVDWPIDHAVWMRVEPEPYINANGINGINGIYS